MAIEAISGAGMTYQGSTSTAEKKIESSAKVERTAEIDIADEIAKKTTSIDTKETGSDGDANSKDSNPKSYSNDKEDIIVSERAAEYRKDKIKKAVDDINKRANNSEAIFGIHEDTNRVTIKLIDKDTKEVIKELPPERTLDMIAKVWEMAGILVDEKR